jgi:hypothetical protein
MEDMIVDTVFGTFIVEDYGDAGYDVATNLTDSDCYYHIPKGLSKEEVKELFVELKELED